jgi:hypothetical protein
MPRSTIKDRVGEELRNYAVVAAYLFVCFAAVMFHESTMPGASVSGPFSLTTAAIKALILGKFILIGEAVGIGDRSRAPRLAGAIVFKSLQFLLLLVLLSVAEELIVGKVHGQALSATVADYEQRSVLHMLAKCLLMLLILLPLIATREFSRILGPGVLRGMLTGRKPDGG